jgi:formyl-CoA transferase
MHDSQPLAGIKVIDFTQVMLGPCCTQTLGDYGADVIKIERIGAGDLSRSSIEDPAGQLNPIFCSLNRNKRSIALDLKAPAGIAVVHRLVASGDVVVNNFRAGVMERMGLGYDALAAINPRIIFAFGTGFGTEGPYSHKGGQDILAQAMSGSWPQCDPSEPLTIYPTALADYSAECILIGHPAGALAAGADRPWPAGRGIALRQHAGDADAGSRNVADARAGFLLGSDAAHRRI